MFLYDSNNLFLRFQVFNSFFWYPNLSSWSVYMAELFVSQPFIHGLPGHSKIFRHFVRMEKEPIWKFCHVFTYPSICGLDDLHINPLLFQLVCILPFRHGFPLIQILFA